MDDNQKKLVSIVRCEIYHPATIRASLVNLLAPFGGISAIVKPGQKVLLKPNLLAAVGPAVAATTHPLIVKAMIELIHEVGAHAFVGDSPGSGEQKAALLACGMQQAIEETGAKALEFTTDGGVKIVGTGSKVIPLAVELGQVDLVINMAKLKTHALTGLTGAVKNVYGCVVGRHKTQFHLEHPLPLDFSRFLLQIYLTVKPAFSIIDAVVAMEGSGPRRGKPRKAGLILGATDGIALDRAAAEITGFTLNQVTTLAAAKKLKLPGLALEELAIKGLSLDESRIEMFDKGPAATGQIGGLLARLPLGILKNLVHARRPYPVVDTSQCDGCGVCVSHCPAQVIALVDQAAFIEAHECIRCYCCQEFCARGAVCLKPSR